MSNNSKQMIRPFFWLCIFTGSFLLFLIQPMVGKILLPCLGGSPSVWTTCMLFFQFALLAGYVYAERSITILGYRKQSSLHLVLMISGCLFLPIDVDLTSAATAFNQPVVWLFSKLTFSIGFLFFIIAANAPLVQRYYSQAGQVDSTDPYFLYSASNAGSLTALAAYPFFFEPLLKLSQQKFFWSGLYVVQIFLLFMCCRHFFQSENELPVITEKSRRPVWREIAGWTFLGFVPCSAMLAVTTHIATDIASGPILWIFPLSLYLVSFILAYAKSSFWRDFKWEIPLLHAIMLVIIVYHFNITHPVTLTIPLHLAATFLVCMYFHSFLARIRPEPELLNSYYVWMSVGGIAGGLFNGIIAPTIFAFQAEYLITMFLAAFSISMLSGIGKSGNYPLSAQILTAIFYTLLIGLLAGRYHNPNISLIGGNTLFFMLLSLALLRMFFNFSRLICVLTLLIVLAGSHFSWIKDNNLLIGRNFFGILKVARVTNEDRINDRDLGINKLTDLFYCLYHGTTLHGVERKVNVRPVYPLSYYCRESPIGAAFRAGVINRAFRNIGVIGLGCGTLAWYGRSWQHFDFFEIDPQVVAIAENPQMFTYLKNSRASWKTIVGDARINLQTVADNSYDLLVVDAYSSDSIPLHLVTLEAFRLYKSKLKPDGLLMLHVSNRYFHLAPIIRRICDQMAMKTLESLDLPKNYSNRYDWYDLAFITPSVWVAASPDQKRLNMLKCFRKWDEPGVDNTLSVWTDDHANLLQVYKWQ